jgi:hypothetical protein
MDMKKCFSTAIIAAGLISFAAPSWAGGALLLSCKCKTVINDGKPGNCRGPDSYSVKIDFDKATAQLIFLSETWDPLSAEISETRIRIVAKTVMRNTRDSKDTITAPWYFYIDRTDGSFTDKIDLGQGLVTSGICTKVDAPKF